jgi:Ni/Co efflux regulator RcnB
MKGLPRTLAVSALTLALSGGLAFAQEHQSDHHDSNDHHAQQHQRYVKHKEWRKGVHIGSEDWRRGEQVDWHAHHLKRPPRGYEWREIDGNYVLANPSGVIFSVVVAVH